MPLSDASKRQLDADLERFGDAAHAEGWTRRDCRRHLGGANRGDRFYRAIRGLDPNLNRTRKGRSEPPAERVPHGPERVSFAEPAVPSDQQDVDWTSDTGWDVEPLLKVGRGELTASELIARKKRTFEDYGTRHAVHDVRHIHLPAGPCGVVFFGDPHIDDDGCDVYRLEHDLDLVRETPHMYGFSGGDHHNNWVGRLNALYGDQSTAFRHGLQLIDWYFRQVEWLGVLLGNHDVWNKGEHVLRPLLDRPNIATWAPADLRLELVFPEGANIRIHGRHDFKGHSQYNKTHGNTKKALWDGWADIYAAFHRHTWAHSMSEYDDGRVRTLVRAAGYKRHDEYARDKDFYDSKFGEAVAVVLDPGAPRPSARVTAFADVNDAALFLSAKRAAFEQR
jgi:hypothetical protein